jgi:hypothetical protein
MKIFRLFIVFILLVLNIIPNILFGQNEQMNLLKYWYYRERLKMFVVPGENPGESLVGGIRNTDCHLDETIFPKINPYGTNSLSELDFGQEREYEGYYIGMLATEYKLLNINGFFNDAALTLNELDMAINACIRLDNCESKEPWLLNQDSYDGYFMREDVDMGYCAPYNPNDLLSSYNPINPNCIYPNNHFLELNPQNYPHDDSNPLYFTDPGYYFQTPGNPNWISNSHSRSTPYPPTVDQYYSIETMSQDEAINTLLGLALVRKCLPLGTTNLTREKAEELAKKIVKYIRNTDDVDLLRWRIIDPLGNFADAGNDSRIYAKGFMGATSYINGENIWDWIDENILIGTQPISAIWNNLQYSSAFHSAMNDHMTVTLAAIADNWHLLEAPTTAWGINNITAYYNWDTFYLLLFDVLHYKENAYLSEQKVIDQLNAAPCSGPYSYGDPYYIHSGNGWSASMKFCGSNEEQNDGTGFKGNYTGLDYMLLYNLYRLRYSDEIAIPYFCYFNRNLSGEWPIELNDFQSSIWGDDENPLNAVSFKTIQSTSIVHNHVANSTLPNTGNLTYKAQESIHLKPGFKVEAGAYFHAFIDEIYSCDAYIYSNKILADSNLISDNNPTSIPDTNYFNKETEYFTITPNPCESYVYFKYYSKKSNDVILEFFDLTGEQLKKFIFSGTENNKVIDLSDLTNGIYSYRIYSNNVIIKADKIVILK